MGRRYWVFGFVASFLLALAAAGCSNSGHASSGATATPVHTAAPPTLAAGPSPTATVDPASIQPDGQRIFADVSHLADSIGPRPAGTQRETDAANYLADKLRSFGYEVTLQEFSIGTQSSRESSLTIKPDAQDASTIPTLPFELSGSSQVRAQLVAAGKGATEDFPSQVRGNIALVERGDLLFAEKVANAEKAGAAGVVIYNNEAGTFFGSLQQQANIPAVSISQSDGQALLDKLRAGAVEASLRVAAVGNGVSHNVVAKPPGKECETVTGGHYDSVVQAPGASDNGSGASSVVEIAGVIARRGEMGSNCFVLFGAEELGLLGSKAYVNGLNPDQRHLLKAMLNFDMVGVGDDGWLLLGSPDMQQRGADIAASMGLPAQKGQLPRNTSSDHASFLAAGIPTFFLYRLDDPLLHTPQDVSNRVRPELLQQAAQIGVAMLESLSRA